MNERDDYIEQLEALLGIGGYYSDIEDKACDIAERYGDWCAERYFRYAQLVKNENHAYFMKCEQEGIGKYDPYTETFQYWSKTNPNPRG